MTATSFPQTATGKDNESHSGAGAGNFKELTIPIEKFGICCKADELFLPFHEKDFNSTEKVMLI